jgi:DNA-binding GntR family transcriptional regulator
MKFMKKSDLTAEVYEDIRNKILTFQLLPGVKISDAEVSNHLGISRTPVRQALFRLVERGLLEVRHNRGFWVRKFSPKELADLYVVRMALEVQAVALVASNITESQARELKQALGNDPAADAASLNFMHVMKADWQFHELISKLSGNALLFHTLKGFQEQVWISFPHFGYNHLQLQKIHEEHLRLYECIAKGDVEQSKKAMENHLQTALQDRLAIYRNISR